MKLTAILLLAVCLQVTARINGQNVSLSVQNASLKEVFRKIQKQTGLNIMVNEKMIAKAGKVTLDVHNMPVQEVLHLCLQNEPLSFSIVDNAIIVKPKLSPVHTPTTENNTTGDLPPPVVITGKVINENGEPLESVSIMIKGEKTGTTTDKNGNFTIQASDQGTLVFSNVGYISQEIQIKNRQLINITLRSAQNENEQIVVVGYGTQRKRDVTGSISKISANTVKDVPVQGFEQALSGRAAGVNVTIPNGILGNPPVIRVRGINSISLSSYPLIVVDGIPTWSGDVGGFAHNNALADINPSDIESFEILKDAAAAAIYGSRAAAGVVLITTKKGKSGKAKVNYESWVGVSKAMNLIEMLGAEDYTMLKNEALANAGTPANGTTRGFYTMKDINGNLVDTRWYDKLYRTGTSHNHNLNISGANETTQYFFSLGYTDQKGIIKTNDFSRKTGRFTLDHKVNDRITVGGSFNYSKSFNQGVITGAPTEARPEAVFAASGVTRLAMIMPPNVGVYKNDGSWNYNGLLGMGQGNNITPLSFLPNFVMALELNSQTSETDRIMSNTYIAIKLLKGMEFKSVYGIDNLLVENKEYRNPWSGEGSRFLGASSAINGRYQRYNWQNLLNYNVTVNQDHHLGFLLGAEQQKSTRNSWGADRRIVADSLYTLYQGAYSTIFPFGNIVSENFLQSYFSRINYDFKKKYYLSVNARRDGYSAFAPGQKFGNFAGASAGWVISQESFFTKSKISNVLNQLQLRASYGKVGNNLGIGDFAFHNLFNNGLNGTNNTLFFSQAGNSNLTWETSKKIDVGFSFGLLNNRITGEFSYYKNNIDGLILDDPQSPSAGIPGNSILNNIGSMWNKGIEFTVNASIIRKKDFTWNTSLNFTTQKNRITALAAGNSDIILVSGTLAPLSIARVGESLGSFYAIRSGAVNPANGRRIFYYRDGTAVQYDHSAANSSLRWTYLDGSPAPRSPSQNADGIVMGPALPKYFGGFDNTFRYKGIDMNVLVFFSGGNYMFNGTKSTMRTPTTANHDKEVLTRWQKPGQVTDVPRLVFGDLVSNGSRDFVISDDVEKADFIKVRNISLGYSIPDKLVSKAGLSKIRFYATVQNAFVFTKYSGYDPEISTNKNSTGTPSVDFHSPPMARTFSFGLNVGF
ncbi:MAG: TonB-dependent receptor [Chitinophagaceae bacterium]|nr:TonB-dependent receptor [Chitinophagaceae bacterium]